MSEKKRKKENHSPECKKKIAGGILIGFGHFSKSKNFIHWSLFRIMKSSTVSSAEEELSVSSLN